MIKIYPTTIEAYDDVAESLVFKLTTFDAYTAELEINKSLVCPNSVDELCDAIKVAVGMLELDRVSDGEE